MPSSNQELYNSQFSDIAAIAKCHQACFRSSLSGKLGLAYIKKTFEWFLGVDNRFLFHIQINNEVIGYCGGFISKGIGDGSSSGMLQYAFKQAAIGVAKKPWLIFHPEVMAVYPFIFKNIKKKLFPSKNKITNVTSAQGDNVTKFAGLVVIGVHPDHRGTGVFDQLMEHFFEESKQRNLIGCKLSVRKDNARGINAYKKFGWYIEQETEKTYVLRRDL